MKYKVYTDGSGDVTGSRTGGWAFVLQTGDKVIKAAGFEDNSTNNRMEMEAVIRALEHLTQNYPDSKGNVEVFSDSQYVVNGASSWLEGWKAKGWRTTSGEVKNVDLWKKIDFLKSVVNPKFTWIKGHSDCEANNVCDSLANYARENRTQIFKETLC